MLISIVIPCFNSSQSLNELCRRIDKAMAEYEYELILVNDNSPDTGKTWNEIIINSEANKNIIGIDLQKK